MAEPLLGYCGLYCGGCPTYQGLSVAEDGTPVRCEGCNSATVAPCCSACAVKACAREKNLRYCLLCDEYPCGKHNAFVNDPRYPYHKLVHRDMVRLKATGIADWLREQVARWTCPNCAGTIPWATPTCPTCGGDISAVVGRLLAE